MNKRRILERAAIAAAIIVSIGMSGCSAADQSDVTDDSTIEVTDTISEFGETTVSTANETSGTAGTSIVGANDSETTTVLSSETIESSTETEMSKSDGGFNVSVQETTVTTTTPPPETYVPETEPPIQQMTAPEVPIGEPIDNKYAYNTLSAREQELYDSIYGAMMRLEPTVDIATNNYTEDEWTKVFSDVYYQETHLFWVDPYLIPGEIYYKTTNTEEIEAMKKEIDNTAATIINGAAEYATEIDRVKYIHDYLVSINDFEKGGGGSYSPTIYGGLVLGHPQCEGYAKTFAYICNKLGMETIVMTGNVASGASHAWNKIKVGGNWYNIDLTNDDPILQTPSSKYIRHNFFMVPDAWIENVSHFRFNLSQMYSGVELFKAPTATSSDYYFFNYYDKAYSGYNSAYNELLNRVVNGVNNRESLVQIRALNYDTYNQLKNNLVALKDDAKVTTGGPWKRIAAASDDNLYIISISFEY